MCGNGHVCENPTNTHFPTFFGPSDALARINAYAAAAFPALLRAAPPSHSAASNMNDPPSGSSGANTPRAPPAIAADWPNGAFP